MKIILRTIVSLAVSTLIAIFARNSFKTVFEKPLTREQGFNCLYGDGKLPAYCDGFSTGYTSADQTVLVLTFILSFIAVFVTLKVLVTNKK